MKDNKIIFIAEMPQGGSYEKGNLEELRNAIIWRALELEDLGKWNCYKNKSKRFYYK